MRHPQIEGNPLIILASNSPRRKDLLRQIGVAFTSDPADVDESMVPGESPREYALRVSFAKARVAADRAQKGLIIAADTVVVLEDAVLGKPIDTCDAVRMLSILSGRMHRVITGVAALDAVTGKSLSRSAVTNVWFRELTREEIAAYAATGEPLDKAGAYGIQGKGALLVEKIEGCYFNVVGLPLSLLGAMLKEFDIKLFP